MTEHNYMNKLLRLEAESKIPHAPGLWHTDIEHDDWCGINKGRRCNCDPDVYVYPHGNRAARRKL
ncbi:MAG: hypothetical protein WBY44_03175 [Bryobacteraceae bacterium]